MKRSGRSIWCAVLALWGCFLWPTAHPLAQEPTRMETSATASKVVLGAGQSSVLGFDDPIERISVNNESIADVVVVSPTQLLVQGKQPGSTGLIVWQSGQNHFFNVTVEAAAYRRGTFDAFLHELVPEEDQLRAYESDKTIILAGKAKHPANVAKAVQAANSAAEKVVNIVDVQDPKQVLIEVRFAEVDRRLAKAMGIDYIFQNADVTQSGFTGGSLAAQTPATPKFGRISDGTDVLLSSAVNQLLEWRGGGGDLTVAIHALEEKGLIRILAEPNLLAMSGEKASFLAGGEFPIPVVQSSGSGNSVTIEFKEFGIHLDFKPEVTAGDSIRLSVAPEVSVLDFGPASVRVGGFQVPALVTRRTSTTVEMRPGESLVIGGLLSQTQTNDTNQVPILGSVPILGQLFKSEKFKNEETELLVLVTPRLVQPKPVDMSPRYKDPQAIGETLQKYEAPPYPDERGDELRRAIGVPEIDPTVQEGGSP